MVCICTIGEQKVTRQEPFPTTPFALTFLASCRVYDMPGMCRARTAPRLSASYDLCGSRAATHCILSTSKA